tara:strand:+ start:1080 stop:4076 length:2997 start_codon:yes stop_codon:yes gene_type:complete
MASYGDIVEINGEFFEFTPVGYMPVSAPSTDGGMLTMPDDTITPSPTGDVIVKEEPTTTTTQTEPTGIPTSDPTKTQPGETGPFDPNAPVPTPAPAPPPDAGPVKGDPPKQAPIPPEPEGISTFTFFKGVERGDANPNALYARGDSTQVTEAELREYFNAEGSQMLKQAFGDFDNYLAYMTEREQLLQSGDYDVGNWDEYTGSLTEDELMILEGEDLTQYGDDAQADYTELYGERMQEQSSAYDRWVNSEENQALLAKYGVDGTMYNSDGDTFKWNGSAYVKTNKIDDSINIGDIAKLGFAVALSVVGTPAIANALAPNALAGSSAALAANATASSIVNAATQLLTTGQIDPEGALRAAATSFLSNTAMDALRESGVFGQVGDVVNTTTTDQLLDADGNVIGQIVRDSAGNIVNSSGVSANEWFTYATELGATINEGQTLVSQIASVLPDVPEWLYDAAQTTVDAVDQLFEETRAGVGGEGEGGSIFDPGIIGATDIFDEVEGGAAEEDILADTIQEATGLEASVIQDLFNDYMEEYRSEFEAQDALTVEQIQQVVASELAGLEQPETLTPEQIEQIVNNAISTIPEADTLTQEQVQEIVNGAVSAIEIPQGITTEEVSNIVNEAIAGIPAGTSPEQVQEIVNQAISGIVIPEGMTSEEVQQIVDTAVSGIQFPEGISVEDVDRIVSEAIGNIQFPEIDTLSTDEVQDIVNTAISDIQFPEGVTAEQVLEIIQAQLEAQPEGLTSSDVTEIVSQAINGIEFPASVTQEEVTALIGEVQESLSGDLEAYQQSTAEQLEAAEEERAELGGQLGTLTDEVADIAEDLINVGGNLENLDERTQDRLNELGLDLEDLSLLVNVNFEALQEGALTRESAMQELIEETATRTEEQVAGLGEQVGGLMGGLEGLGQQVGGLEGALEGLGEGLGQLGLGTLGGLFGLGQQQQQLAQQQLAMLSKPEIRPFQKQEFKGLGYQRSPIQEIQQKPVSQQNLDKLIKGMLV